MPRKQETPPTGTVRAVADILSETFRRSAWNQTRLGEAVGMSQSQVSDILAGKKQMDLREYLALCDALRLSPRRVMAEAEARANLSPEEWAAIQAERAGETGINNM